MKVYQNFCWRGVGTGRSIAGFMAPLENGWMAELDSAVASDLAMGASGSAVRTAEPLKDSEATSLAVVGESFAGCLGCSAVGSHIRRSAAESSKDHLSMAADGKAAEGCNRESLAVPEYRCHWPIGHVLNSTLGRRLWSYSLP